MGSGFRDSTQIVENQMEEKVEMKWTLGLCS